MLETGGLCFRKIQDWQSAPDGELVCCFFCGCRLCGHIPATLHLCDVIKRATPHAIWSFFSIKNMSNSVLPLWAFIKIVLLIEKPCIFTYMYFYVCLFPVSKVWCFSWLCSRPVMLQVTSGGSKVVTWRWGKLQEWNLEVLKYFPLIYLRELSREGE